MASAQCHKPTDQTKNHANEHKFSDKVKEMAHSARKMFNHHEHHEQGQHVSNHKQKPTSNSSSGTAHSGVKTEKKKMGKHTEGHEKHCMPKMFDHMKRKKHKEGKHGGGGSSDSGSSSDSDNETVRKMK